MLSAMNPTSPVPILEMRGGGTESKCPFSGNLALRLASEKRTLPPFFDASVDDPNHDDRAAIRVVRSCLRPGR